MELRSDFNEYPYRVFASVILLDNKIINWKVANYRWTKHNYASSNQPKIVYDNEDKIQIRSRSFLCKNRDEHHAAFEKKATKFFKQFKLYPGFNLLKPY